MIDDHEQYTEPMVTENSADAGITVSAFPTRLTRSKSSLRANLFNEIFFRTEKIDADREPRLQVEDVRTQLGSGQASDELELTLCRGDGFYIPMRYRFTGDERSMPLTKMRDYCQMCGTPDERREQYLAEQGASSVPEQSM